MWRSKADQFMEAEKQSGGAVPQRKGQGLVINPKSTQYTQNGPHESLGQLSSQSN